MDIFSGREIELAALVLVLLILLQLWIELRQIQRSDHGAGGKAFLQVQMHRDNRPTSTSSFGGKQPAPGDRDEFEQPRDRADDGH